MLLDLGTCSTKVVLLDVVEGQYRAVATAQAPSTVGDPWQDLSLGAVAAISRLEEVCGRCLLGERAPSGLEQRSAAELYLITPEDEEGRGVDRLLVVSSAGEPLRVLLAGLVHDVSLASARRAVGSTYARVQDVIALEQDPESTVRRSASTKIDTILKSDADVVLLVGGTDGGASEPMIELVREVVRVALYLMREDAPHVLFAGNQALAGEIQELFQNVAPVKVTDNVRPTTHVEDSAPAAQELNSLFHERKMRMLPGLRTIRGWSRSLVLPTVRATETAIRCCAQVFETGKPALGVDLGGANVALHLAQQRRVRTTVRTDLGIGASLLGLLDQVEVSQITRWLPFALSETAFLDWFYHKVQHPQTISQTRRELLIELAAARELIRLGLADLLPGWEAESAPPVADSARDGPALAPPCDPIVGSGSLLSYAPHPGLAALVLLDALMPLGVSTLYQDESGLLPALGAVAMLDPMATVQMLSGEGLLPLGTVVSPQGRARSGVKALTVRSLDPAVEIEQTVGYGELCVISPSLLGQASEPPPLELIPGRAFDLGRGVGKSIQISFKPGVLGLIVDARGRPLDWAPEGEARQAQMDEWLFTMTGERGT